MNDKIPMTTEALLEATSRLALPSSDEAEKGVLSCLLQEPEQRISEVRAKLPPEAFYHPGNRTIYETLLAMDSAAPPIPIGPPSLTHQLRAKDALDMVGGPAEISELFGFVPITSHFAHFVKLMKDRWTLRRLVHASAENLEDVGRFGTDNVDPDVTALVAAAENRVFSVLEDVQASGEFSKGMVPACQGVATWAEHLQTTIDNKGKISGLTTGIHEIDMTLHGLDDKEGEICVIAARPGQGKTALALNIAEHLAVTCAAPGLIFSAEMSANQLYTRLILGPALVDTSKAITGMFSHEDHQAMTVQSRKVQKAPLWVSDGASISTADLRAQTQVAKRQHGLRWIIVDHLHLIKAVSAAGQKDERMRLVEVMECLQFLKKQHNLVVFVMVQLNRETDRNAGKPPVLADLAGSAASEQYADHVMMLHREPYFMPWHRLPEEKQKGWRECIQPRRGRSPDLWSDGMKYEDEDGGFARQDYEEQATIYVRKNRRGPTPELQVRFRPEFTLFSTRMPCLTSGNPLDHQMGSYAVVKKSKDPKKPSGGKNEPTWSKLHDDD
jgi:replicative DNA helicase